MVVGVVDTVPICMPGTEQGVIELVEYRSEQPVDRRVFAPLASEPHSRLKVCAEFHRVALAYTWNAMAFGFLRQFLYMALVPMQHYLCEVIYGNEGHPLLSDVLGEQQLSHLSKLIDEEKELGIGTILIAHVQGTPSVLV